MDSNIYKAIENESKLLSRDFTQLVNITIPNIRKLKTDTLTNTIEKMEQINEALTVYTYITTVIIKLKALYNEAETNTYASFMKRKNELTEMINNLRNASFTLVELSKNTTEIMKTKFRDELIK